MSVTFLWICDVLCTRSKNVKEQRGSKIAPKSMRGTYHVVLSCVFISPTLGLFHFTTQAPLPPQSHNTTHSPHPQGTGARHVFHPTQYCSFIELCNIPASGITPLLWTNHNLSLIMVDDRVPSPSNYLHSRLRSMSSLALSKTPHSYRQGPSTPLRLAFRKVSTHPFFEISPPFAYIDS